MNYQLSNSNSNDPIVRNTLNMDSNKVFKKLKFYKHINNFQNFQKEIFTSNILSYFYPINEPSNSNDPILFRNNLNIYSNKVFKKLKFLHIWLLNNIFDF